MPSQIIDGKKLAEQIQAALAREIIHLKRAKGVVPGLAAVLVGTNEASKVYVKNKKAACEKVGMHAEQHHLPETATEGQLLALIESLNQNPSIHGILVQLPLPRQIGTERILSAIRPDKDADGFHPVNMGNLLIGRPTVMPCTPFGVLKMIESTGLEITGKRALVIGRSNIVGKPIALLLLQKNATVTIGHSKTVNLAAEVSEADILIAAIGRPQFVKGSWIKEGAVVIDVGINRLPDGKLVGDVEFEEARKRAAYISPVPGGVGPMTIAMLLSNTLEAAKRSAAV